MFYIVNNVEKIYEFNFFVHTLCWLIKVSLFCSYDFYNPLLFNQLRGRIIQSWLFSLQDTFSEWGNGPKSKLEFGVIDLFCKMNSVSLLRVSSFIQWFLLMKVASNFHLLFIEWFWLMKFAMNFDDTCYLTGLLVFVYVLQKSM